MKEADYLLDYKIIDSSYILLNTTSSQTRIYFMGDGVIRIHTSFNGIFTNESLSLVWTAWEDLYDDLLKDERIHTTPLVPNINDELEKLIISCDNLIVSINKKPFSISFLNSNNEILFEDVKGRSYTYSNGQVTHSFCLDDSNFYGFGEKTGRLEKTNTRMKMSNKDACGYDATSTDPLYKHIPWFIKLSNDGSKLCGVYYNTSSDCGFDIGKEYNGYWPRMGQYQAYEEEVDMFFIAGKSFGELINKFTKLTGRPMLLPKYAFNYLGSTMYYSELEKDCDKEILDFIDHTKREELLCYNYHLSSGYTTDDHHRRNVFSWNNLKFPNPKEFISQMDKRNVSLTPNIKPCILKTNPIYERFKNEKAFISTKNGEPYVLKFWGGDGSLVDFTNPSARNLWQEYIESSLLDYGIYSIWNDNNEFDINDDEVVCFNEGEAKKAIKVKARLPMLMNIVSKKAIEKAYPNKRLYQVTRSGNTGINRYAQTWTGDNYTSWNTLKYNIATMLGSGLSGIANTGSDIGGFAGPCPDSELFNRWIWCGVLLPRFSIHSANNDNTVTEPWMYKEIMPSIKKAFKLREKLLPYLYSLNAHANKTGEPILRPMVYEFTSDINCRYEDVDFMIGDSLLAACVVTKGAKEREVYLPKDEIFYDFFTRKPYKGGKTIRVPAPLDTTPLFQKGGSIIPLANDDSIEIWICPNKDYTFTLYEDDGVSNEYLNGEYLNTKFSLKRKQGTVIITSTKSGNYNPSKNLIYYVQCDNLAPKKIYFNNKELPMYLDEERFNKKDKGWHYFPSNKTCAIKCEDGRSLDSLEVCFDIFDLIQMDIK